MSSSSFARTAVLAASAVLLVANAFAQVAQPATESLDLATISRIRDEGLMRSHVMEYASGLFDGVGARLTWSPEFERGAQWSVAQLKAMGVSNPHVETWDDTGMAWTQIGTSVLLTEPSSATLLAQATPWSPATAGEVSGAVIRVARINDEAGLAAWKGKLAGKIVLYGDAPKVDPNAKDPMEKAELDKILSYPLSSKGATDYASLVQKLLAPILFQEKVAKFFADEHALAALVSNGSGATFTDDTISSFGWYVYQSAHKQALPSAVVSADGFGRMARLVEHDVPVMVKVNIQTKFGADAVKGENVVGEIPGTDPKLKDQVVMVGGHLDSWASATGATDNGAGTIVALEAMRILRTLGLQPRRTIRIGLWGGEEQGLFGSFNYVKQHFAGITFSNDPALKDVPQFVLPPTGVTPKPEAKTFDVYLNTDNGTGKYYGVYTEGNAEAAHVFSQWGETVKDLGFSTVTMRGTEGTDHLSFQMVGLPGFQFVQDPRDYETRTHHTNLDTYERLSEPDLKQAATITAIFLWNASQRDAMFPRKALSDFAGEAKDSLPLTGVYSR